MISELKYYHNKLSAHSDSSIAFPSSITNSLVLKSILDDVLPVY